MNRDPLSEALRTLPREKASADFTARVLARLDDLPRRRDHPWLVSLIAAAAVIVLVAGLWLVRTSRLEPTRDSRARIEALQAEHARLERELARIRSLAAQPARQQIYLGGSDDYDVVLDVGWLALADDGVGGGVAPVRWDAGNLATPGPQGTVDLALRRNR